MKEIRRSKHGITISNFMQTHKGFVTSQELFELLRSQDIKIGLATVYRQLQALTSQGVLDQIRTKDGQQAYRFCSPEHHHHITCRSCRKTKEFIDNRLADIFNDLALERDYILTGHDLELYGLCSDCQEDSEED